MYRVTREVPSTVREPIRALPDKSLHYLPMNAADTPESKLYRQPYRFSGRVTHEKRIGLSRMAFAEVMVLRTPLFVLCGYFLAGGVTVQVRALC